MNTTNTHVKELETINSKILEVAIERFVDASAVLLY